MKRITISFIFIVLYFWILKRFQRIFFGMKKHVLWWFFNLHQQRIWNINLVELGFHEKFEGALITLTMKAWWFDYFSVPKWKNCLPKFCIPRVKSNITLVFHCNRRIVHTANSRKASSSHKINSTSNFKKPESSINH